MPWPDMPPTLVEKAARALCARHYAKRFNKPESDPHVQINVKENWQIFIEDARVVLVVAVEECAKVADNLESELDHDLEPMHIDEDTGTPRWAALSAYQKCARGIRSLAHGDRGSDITGVVPDGKLSEVGRLHQLIGDIQSHITFMGEETGSRDCCERYAAGRTRDLARVIDGMIMREIGSDSGDRRV